MGGTPPGRGPEREDGAVSPRRTIFRPLRAPGGASAGRGARLRNAARQARKGGAPRFRTPKPARVVAGVKSAVGAGVARPTRYRPKLRLRVTGGVLVVLFAMLFLRLWDLQVLNAAVYKKAVLSNSIRTVVTQPLRGEILARNGQVLAGNTTAEEITLSRLGAHGHPQVVGRLAALLGIDAKQISATLADSRYSLYEPVPVMINAPLSAVIYIRQHAGEFPGVAAKLTSIRTYPQGDTAAQVLGYIDQITQQELTSPAYKGYQAGDVVGQSGVEATYQQWLRGTPGAEELEVNAVGQVVGVAHTTASKPGNDVVLSIDLSLQKYVEQQLASEISALRNSVDASTGLVPAAPGGAAVVLDPQNGQVLAMASFPTYNPSLWVGGISSSAYNALTAPSAHHPLLNRAIAGEYTPGSTFKIATATAALDSGLVTPNTYINDTGVFTVPNCNTAAGACSFHNAGHEALGEINIVTALTASDDVFFYTLGFRFGIAPSTYGQTPIQNTANAYGLGELSGIALPGEAKGQVDSPALRLAQHQAAPKAFPNAGWYIGDDVELAFGQGETLITPLQLANAYATFANGGTRFQPQIAAGVRRPNGRVVQTFAPVVAGHVNLPASTRGPMLAGFEGAVQSPMGTAYYPFRGFNFSAFPLAGKTGTATTTAHHGQEPTALFVVFGPTTDPQYVVAVVIEQGGYGTSGAAPVARKVMDYLVAHPIGPVHVGTPSPSRSPARH